MNFKKSYVILPVFMVICTAFLLVGCGNIGQEAPVLSENNISVNYQAKTITINLDNSSIFEYSIDNGAKWQIEKTFSDVVPGTYSVVVRYKETEEKQASPKSNTISVLMKDMPATPVLTNENVDLNETTITIDVIQNAEYSINNGTTWQDSNVFSNLVPGNSYQVVVRIKAIGDAVASNVSNIINITVDKLNNTNVPVLNAYDVSVNQETATIFINSSLENIEYSFDNGANWTNNNSLVANRGQTYKVVIRFKENATTKVSNNSQAISVFIKNTQNAPTLNETEITTSGNIITVNKAQIDDEIYEYKFSTATNPGEWQSRNDFVASYGVEYVVYVRIVGTENALYSNASNGVNVLVLE